MSGPYTFEIDRESETWTAYNNAGDQIDTGDLPLTGVERRVAICSDHGINDPTATALEDIWTGNWSDNNI